MTACLAPAHPRRLSTVSACSQRSKLGSLCDSPSHLTNGKRRHLAAAKARATVATSSRATVPSTPAPTSPPRSTRRVARAHPRRPPPPPRRQRPLRPLTSTRRPRPAVTPPQAAPRSEQMQCQGRMVPTNAKPQLRNAITGGSGVSSTKLMPGVMLFSLLAATTAQTDTKNDTKRNSWACAAKANARNAVRMGAG